MFITPAGEERRATAGDLDSLASCAASLALYCLHGLYPDLVEPAVRRDDLLFVDLPTRYGIV